MIQLSSLSKSFGDRILLEAVNWQIDDRERVGLSGPNGAGKTTLLKMLAGLDEPDSGLVVKPSGLTIGYLPQDGLHHTGRTLREEAGLAFKMLLDMRAEIAIARGAPRRRCGPRVGACRDADAVQRAAGRVQTPRRLQHRPEDHDRAARSRLLRRRHGSAERDVLRRLADAHRPREAPARQAGSAPPRRTDEPPRSRRAQLARGVPLELPARRHPRVARPFLPRRRGHAHHRNRVAEADGLHGELQRLPSRARGTDGAPPPAETRSGRGSRQDGSLHQPLPLSGDEGRAGSEPDQDARQGRADRDPARAQARALHVSRVREERTQRDRSPGHIEGVRRETHLRPHQPADRTGRSHRAHRPERRRQVHPDADALRRRVAGCGYAHRRAIRS